MFCIQSCYSLLTVEFNLFGLDTLALPYLVNACLVPDDCVFTISLSMERPLFALVPLIWQSAFYVSHLSRGVWTSVCSWKLWIREYIRVFELLLFEECRAQLYSSYEESLVAVSRDAHVMVCVGTVDRHDCMKDIHFFMDGMLCSKHNKKWRALVPRSNCLTKLWLMCSGWYGVVLPAHGYN